MDFGIAGKNALITGGSRGLGRQSALSLAGEGVNVFICARGGDTVQETVAELSALGVKAQGAVADITNAGETAQAFEGAINALGSVDILINNVGGSLGGALEQTTEEQLDETFRLNLTGALQLIRLALPSMREQRWGRIVNITSIYGREHGGSFGYMTAKAAVIAASKHLALNVAKDGITVNSVAPGSILFDGGPWDRFQQSQSEEVVNAFISTLPMGKFGWPEPIGDYVAFLASERAGLITGTSTNVDGGQSKSLL